jgi:hypothetical protein
LFYSLISHSLFYSSNIMTNDTPTIQTLKDWALANYENGADTLVECWGDEDYEEVIREHGADALAFIQRIAAVYADRQADARNCW